MTNDEMIKVLQAHKEGKTIETKRIGRGEWTEVSPCWNFQEFEYRVKPVPRSVFINDYGDGLGGDFYIDKQSAVRFCGVHGKTVEFVEKIT